MEDPLSPELASTPSAKEIDSSPPVPSLTNKAIETCLFDLSPYSPFRPPNWRWLLANYLAAGHRPVHRRLIDHWVREAKRYLMALHRCHDESDRQRLACRMPDIDAVFRLFAAPPSLSRWELEARLLTEEPFDQIAAECGITPEIVEAYHQLFYCVRDRLSAPDYIHIVVIGFKSHFGLTENDAEVVIKRLAYTRGPSVIDSLMRYFEGPLGSPGNFDQLNAEAREGLREMLLVECVILARTMPISSVSDLKKFAILKEIFESLDDGPTKEVKPAGPLPWPSVDLAEVLVAEPRSSATSLAVPA